MSGSITVFENMLGKEIVEIENLTTSYGNELIFHTTDGYKFRFYHKQDCCEYVYIEDICGDLRDLLYHPLLQAEMVSSDLDKNIDETDKAIPSSVKEDERYMWTFYKFSTIEGNVTIRWLGTTNSCYSIGVDYEEIPPTNLNKK